MQKTGFAKRFLALVLCFMMVLSTIPTSVLAAEINEEDTLREGYSQEAPDQEKTPVSSENAEDDAAEDAGSDGEDEGEVSSLDLPTTVSIKASTLVQWAGEFATKPLLDMTVSSDTAENYGFADQTDSKENVSAVDVLVAAHVAKYGDGFTKETARDYLVIDGNFINTIFGHNAGGNWCILVNGKMPGSDGIEQIVMNDGEMLEIFEYQSVGGNWMDQTQYLDKYVWLETKDGQKIDGGSLNGGVATELVVKGYAPFYASSDGTLGQTTAVSGAEIYMVNMESGSLTSLGVTSGEDGKVTVTIPKDKIGQTLYLTAKGKEMAMSLNKVTVAAPPATTATVLTSLEVAVGGDTQENAQTQTLSPVFEGKTKSYTTPILDYQASSDKRYVWVKVGAEDTATVTAQCANSETVTLTSGEWAKVAVKTMSWGRVTYSGCLETGKYNTLTITVTAEGQTEVYTVTIPMQPDTSKSKLSWKTNLAEMVYCNPGSQGKELTVQAQYENRPLDDENEITYQWYESTDGTVENSTALKGQTGESYTASTASLGVKYYYAVAICGEKTLNSRIIAVRVTNETAPTSITVVCDYDHTIPDTWVKALGGVDYVAKIGDQLTLRALDQDGNETPVQWPTNLTTGTLNATTGSTVTYTINNTSYGYIQVSSLFDSTVKSEEKAVVVKNYSIGSSYKNPSVTLSADGQSAVKASTSGGINGYNLWTYEMEPENAAKLTSDLSSKPNWLYFQAQRPGTIQVTLNMDLDGDGKGEDLTDTATLTIKGIAVEDANGELGKTYLETSAKNANPTVQLKALSSTEDATFTWSSADETIATVDENGLVTARGIGSVIISAKDGTYTGGIKVVVTSADVPYFETLDFTTVTTWSTGLSQNSWKSANFKPAVLNYTGLAMTKAAADTLTFSAATVYDTEKWVAVATYTDADGEEQSVTVASGATTALKNLALETSTITVTLTAKDDDSVKTIYTFEVTRPRDTTKTIAQGGIVFAPEGRELLKDKYNEREEGVMYEAKADGSFGTYKGVDYRRTYYRVYAMNELEAFTLTIKGSTNYTHLRYSVDDGATWTYLGQTETFGKKTAPITFPERMDEETNPEVKVTIQILDDATYTANVKAGKDGFADVTPSSYYVWVEQIGVISAECDILTAETPYGDWYPAFDPEHTSYRLVTDVDTKLPVLTYTVSENTTVYLGENLQTPNEDGKYTLQLTEDSQTIVVKASNGMTEKSYSFGAKARNSNLTADRVVDYLPVNSQYTNGYNNGYGLSPQQTLTGGMVSLGNFGGYITFYYEDGLTDDLSHPYGVDFYVDGNAFVDTTTGTGRGSMEPGQVWVSEDGNTWYALAGSEHYEDSTLWDYAVTYTKTETGGTTWVDNYGNTTASTHGRAFSWPDPTIYTMNDLGSKESFTLTGVLIPCIDGSIAGTDNFNSMSSGARFGYVDTMVNGTNNPYAYNDDYKNTSSGFDLAWAVDAKGDPVDVSGKSFHYVKVVTASNLVAGLANEKSTEVSGISRVASTDTAVGKTAAPAGVTFTSSDNSFVLNFEEGKYVYDVELPGMDTVSVTVNGTAEEDNIYVNNQRVASGTAATGFTISETDQRLIRIIVQNGEREPVIYLLKVRNEAEYRLGSLTLWKNQTYYNKGDAPLVYEPAFDPDVYEYTTSVPDHVYNSMSMYGLRVETDVIPTPSEVVSYKYSGSWGVNNVGKTDETGHIGRYISPYQGTVSIKLDGSENTYKIKVNRYATLKNLTIDGVVDQAFDKDITTYSAYADGTKDGIAITATAFAKAYAITINGTTVTSGESYTLPYDWNEAGEMTVEIQLSGSSVETSTYTVNLKKMPRENKPVIISQSSKADYTVIDTASYVQDLFILASANGEMTYQWFYNTTDSTEGGTAIQNATASTYTPPVTEDVIGTRYYYCRITNTGAEIGNVTYSTPTRVTVDPDPTPVATILNPGAALEGYDWDVGYVYAPDAEATPLEGSYTVAEGVEGKITFSWSRRKDAYTGAGIYSAGTNPTEKTLTPMTDISMANDTGWYYYLDVVNEFKGRSYSAHATTGKTYTDASGKIYDVLGVYVFVEVDSAAAPEFTKQPVGASYFVDDSMTSLSVKASKADGGTLTYQWYVNDQPNTEGATALEGKTSTSLSLGKATEAGIKYYYCVATNTLQGHVSQTVSDIVKIEIRDESNLIGKKLKGSGTEEDPYLIQTSADYQAVAELVAQKVSFEGLYLKQTDNIELPADWAGIGCLIDPSVGHINAGKNLAAFSGTLDGGNFTITIPEGGVPLFAYVKGATVKNLNIFGKKIAGYGLVNHLEGVSLSGNAIIIDNVTLKSGSATEKAGFIGTYITNNGFAGCSAGFTVTIKNSKIEENVVIGYNADQKMIGSFAGRINGTIENCVSYATVKGTDYVGGILGTRDNAMGTCSITNCQFYGTVEASGEHAGGILGGGYENSTAPNGGIPNITGCTVKAKIIGKDKVGGILGGDTFVAQSWGAWSMIGNTFSGTVKATSGTYVGGIVGYLLSMNKFTGISENSYNASCGTDKGIGFVKYLDTSYVNPAKMDGTIVINTANGTSDLPVVTGCAWKADHNRTDDPLGTDAEKLCKKIEEGETVKPTVYELAVSGTYKTEYTVGEELNLSGIKLTAKWTDGNTTDVTLNDPELSVSGYDKNKSGEQTIKLAYGAVEAYIKVNVTPKSNKITVSVTIMGDSKHGDNGEIHGLAMGGLTNWASEKGFDADANETVWDVLQRVFKKYGMSVDADSNNSYGTVYIKSINGLGEFDKGSLSGWMFTVNGKHPEVGVAATYVKQGDSIILHYTDDYTKEEGGKPIEDDDAAKKVDELIEKIGTVSYTDASKDKIDAARKAYNALSAADKKKVTKLPVLEAAEKQYAALKQAEDEKAAKAVIDLIGKIDKDVTLDSEKAIKAARAAYDKLTAEQKALVTNYKTLTSAETAHAKLLANEADKQKAEAVSKQIDALGNITLNSEKNIEDARKAYDALTDLQKKLVENVETLEKAEAKLAVLKQAQKTLDAYKATGDYMINLGTPGIGSVGCEWMVIGLARSDRNIPNVEDYYNSVVKYVQENIDENERLHKAKSTDNSRTILALTAIGKDVTDVDGHNLLVGLNSMDYIKKQGNNGPIWALIALDSGNYPVPEGDVTRKALIDEILSVQTSDGGWAISGDEADADMTGMALTALAPYYKKDLNVLAAVDKAIECLSQMQDADGGFSTFSGDGGKVATSESAAQVIVALTALGINPDTDSRFIKNGKSAIDALTAYFVDGGGFKHIMSGERDGMATEQSYYALTAYHRFLENKTSLYDMTDVIDMGGDPEEIVAETTEPTISATTEPTTAEPVEANDNGSFPWTVIGLVLAAGFGGGIATVTLVIPRIKKKRS